MRRATRRPRLRAHEEERSGVYSTGVKVCSVHYFLPQVELSQCGVEL